MTNMDIDAGLNAHLGLPVGYQLGKIEAFKLYQYLMSLFHTDKPIGQLMMLYYIDRHGDFINNPKNKQDFIMIAIHENMEKSDQFETLKYIEYYNETDGFTDFTRLE